MMIAPRNILGVVCEDTNHEVDFNNFHVGENTNMGGVMDINHGK